MTETRPKSHWHTLKARRVKDKWGGGFLSGCVWVREDFFCSIHAYEACFASCCMPKHFFVGKSVVLLLLEGPELRAHYWEDWEEKKAHHPGGFEPTTSLLQGLRSTAVLQLLPVWRMNGVNFWADVCEWEKMEIEGERKKDWVEDGKKRAVLG